MKKVLVICLFGFFMSFFAQLPLNEARAEDITIENSPFLDVSFHTRRNAEKDAEKFDKAPPAFEVVEIWFSDVLKDTYCQGNTPLVVNNLKIRVDTRLEGTFLTYTKKHRQHAIKATLMVPSEKVKKRWKNVINRVYKAYLRDFTSRREAYLEYLTHKQQKEKEREEKIKKAKDGKLIVVP